MPATRAAPEGGTFPGPFPARGEEKQAVLKKQLRGRIDRFINEDAVRRKKRLEEFRKKEERRTKKNSTRLFSSFLRGFKPHRLSLQRNAETLCVCYRVHACRVS